MTAAILWLLGVEVLPNLHLAAHHHDHTHAADGSIVLHASDHQTQADTHGHSHDAVPHEHHDHHVRDDADLAALAIAHEHLELSNDIDSYLFDVDDHHHDVEVTHDETEHVGIERERSHRHSNELAIDQHVPGHSSGGIAHHALALHQPPPPALAPVATPNVETWIHAAPNERVSTAGHARPNARGPPAV